MGHEIQDALRAYSCFNSGKKKEGRGARRFEGGRQLTHACGTAAGNADPASLVFMLFVAVIGIIFTCDFHIFAGHGNILSGDDVRCFHVDIFAYETNYVITFHMILP